MNTTLQQLDTIRLLLLTHGWSRVNGNTWERGVWCLKFSYAHREATVTVVNKLGKVVGSKQRSYYRGENPLTWLATETVTAVRYNFAKALDKLVVTK